MLLFNAVHDVQVLHYIAEVLGFGKLSDRYHAHRFVVQDKANIWLIVSLFNGNLVLPGKQLSFFSFLEAYNVW